MPAVTLAALLLAPVSTVAAAGPTEAAARAFLQSIYGYYKKGSWGAPMKRPERWFEPALAAAIRKDSAEADKRGDMSKLDADPFCDCQDFESLTPVIGPVTIAGQRASVSVTIDNGGPVTIGYTLVWTRSGWRVFDIQWEEGNLREMYFPTM